MVEDELPPKPSGPLRSGWTTGACAAAAAKAAAQALATGQMPATVAIRLPQGQTPSFAVVGGVVGADFAEAGIVKDAGDDPDVTHGAEIRVHLARNAPGLGLVFCAGTGVGTVTKPGLALAVGEPAINPGPRAIIAAALADYGADWIVTVAIPDGKKRAVKTLNARLGIVGGLSVLGTSGIVTPYSCAAWIHSIHRGIDVARAEGLAHVAAATGSTSEAFVKGFYALPDSALLDMGDFAGGTLKYLRTHPVARVTVAGGFAKLAKLGAGAMDLHSARSRVDARYLADRLGALGASDALCEAASAPDMSAGAILGLARAAKLPLAQRVAEDALRVATEIAGPAIALDVLVVDRAGALIGQAGP